MPNKKNDLYLYEALELRGEYESRLNTLRNLLPEHKNNGRGGLYGGGSDRFEPVEDFDIKKIRENIKTIEYKQRKLNNAIQLANFENTIQVDGEEISLADALNLRKNTNEKIKLLSNQLSDCAYKKIIYKENRNIEETSDLEYEEIKKELEEKRKLFRELNRKLRKDSFEITIDFKDED